VVHIVTPFIAVLKKGQSLVEKIPHDAPVLIIGLGRFGAATAGELDKLGRDVLAVDEDPALVQKWSDRVKHTAVLDARNMNALEQIGARDFPIAVVATGSSIEASVLITTNLVDLKVPQIWAKAISESHGKILTRIGAHRVIYPEREAGERVAHLVSGRMIDFIRFDDNFALVKMYPPKPIRGLSLTDSKVRSKYNITVVGVKSPGKPFTYATEETVVTNHDLIIVSGTNEDIETFAALDK
jgi:trk system potassium uptake protein TrkA